MVLLFGVCNVVGSSISRETHAGAYTHAGPEVVLHQLKALPPKLQF
jgi:glucosamine--fructose-6-phosphate aminotransferase (isomerizing)